MGKLFILTERVTVAFDAGLGW